MLSDLDLNIAASTGIEDLNIADTAYDSERGIVWAVDTEYGLIRLDLKEKKFAGVPVERLEGGLVVVSAAADGGARGLTQRDGCVVKFAADLTEASNFTARGAFSIASTATGTAAMFLNNGRLEVAKLGEDGKETWRLPVLDLAGFPRGYRGTRLMAAGEGFVVIAGDPKLQAIMLSDTGEVKSRVEIDLPGGTSGETPSVDGHVHYPVNGRGREDYLIASAVDHGGKTAAMLYRSPASPDRLIIITTSLVDPEAATAPQEGAPVPKDGAAARLAPTAYVAKENIDHLGGFDGERILCIGSVLGHRHGRIFTTQIADLETIALDEILQPPVKARWWDKYRLKFNIDSGLAHGDEIEEGRGNFGGQDIRY